MYLTYYNTRTKCISRDTCTSRYRTRELNVYHVKPVPHVLEHKTYLYPMTQIRVCSPFWVVKINLSSCPTALTSGLHMLWPAGQQLVRIFSIFEDFVGLKPKNPEDWGLKTEDC